MSKKEPIGTTFVVVLPSNMQPHSFFDSKNDPIDIQAKSFLNWLIIFIFPQISSSLSALKNHLKNHTNILNISLIASSIESSTASSIETNTLSRDLAIDLWIDMFLFFTSACSSEHGDKMSSLLTPEYLLPWGFALSLNKNGHKVIKVDPSFLEKCPDFYERVLEKSVLPNEMYKE